MIIALTHTPSPKMAECELTHIDRVPINQALLLQQHDGYCCMLERCGANVRKLEVNLALPDCTFVEDTALVLDEVAVMASMGAESRRPEVSGIEGELRKHREIHRIKLPATMEGGDIVRVDRKLLVGLSSRTNLAGAKALEDYVKRYGYSVIPVPVRDCLHLKSACTALPDGRLIAHREWFDADALRAFHLVDSPIEEPWSADVLYIDQTVCLAAEHPRTAALIAGLGFKVETTSLSEFAKAEGGVTCLSQIFVG